MVEITREIIKNNGINFQKKYNKIIKFKPFLGDLFSFSYDSIMEKSIFPKKFEASFEKHNEVLKKKYEQIHHRTVLEIATGSGNIANFLSNDNEYFGVDISVGLLKIANKKFNKNGFKNFELFLASAEDLPFENHIFDYCICNLSLNFFSDIKNILRELKRVLKYKGVFMCSTPVLDRKNEDKTIRGRVYTQKELKQIFEEFGFSYSSMRIKNGALIYFKATLEDK